MKVSLSKAAPLGLWSKPPRRWNQVRRCTARTEDALAWEAWRPPRRLWRIHFKRLKLNHMVPSGFPIVFCLAQGRSKTILAESLWKKGRDINEHPLRLSLSLSFSLKPKEVRYLSVREACREKEPARTKKRPGTAGYIVPCLPC